MERLKRGKFCPKCGSPRVYWPVPQLPRWKCKDCGWEGTLVIEDGKLAKVIKEEWELKERIEKLKELLLEHKVIQFGHFRLTSGKESNYYVDIKRASTNPEILEQIARVMKPYTKEYDCLAAMELGAVPIAVAVSLASNKPYVIVRKGEREHGTLKKIEGPSVNKKRILIVEDVTTTGGTIVTTANRLRADGAVVSEALVVVDREEGASERLAEAEIKLIPMVSISELMKK
jgi:orotate phosphoribosyltransferase